MPLASVIIPTYNRAAPLALTLDSLAGQESTGTDFEVIISDDGSSDETVAIVRGFRDRLSIQYVFHEDLGHRTAATRNAGAAIAAGEVFIFLDSGTVATPGFVAAHLRAHSGAAGGPRAIVGRMAGYEYSYYATSEEPDDALRAELDLGRPFTVARAAELGLADMRDEELARFGGDIEAALLPWRFFWTGNCSVPARAFRGVGGFDERFTGWGAEDVDLGYRLSRAGLPFEWDAEALAVEYPLKRTTARNRENNWRNGRLFLEYHRDPEIELFLMARPHGHDVHDAAAEYQAWAASLDGGASRARPRPESQLELAGRRAVFGNVPNRDDDVLVTPFPVAEASAQHLSIGLFTRLPDGFFSSVHISDYFGPLWQRWGGILQAEAYRLSAHVTLEPSLSGRAA